ncbi:MAG: hypothetical protein R2711_11735 [Acidimicrobiales bacterium]
MDTELDRILADDYLDGVADADHRRAARAARQCQAVETQVSYLRRMVQGRHDIVAGRARPARGQRWPSDVSDLVDRLPDPRRPHPPRSGPPASMEPGELHGALADRLAEITSRVPIESPGDADHEAALASAEAELRRLEAEVSRTVGSCSIASMPSRPRSPPLPGGRRQGRRPPGPRRPGLSAAEAKERSRPFVAGRPQPPGLGPMNELERAGAFRVHPDSVGWVPVAPQALRARRDLQPVPQAGRSGLRKPSAEILQQIAQALEISSDALHHAGILEGARGRHGPHRDPPTSGSPRSRRRPSMQIYESFRAERRAAGFEPPRPGPPRRQLGRPSRCGRRRCGIEALAGR